MNMQTKEQTANALQEAQNLTNEMLKSTQPDAVFSQPVANGSQTIFTASEVSAAMGVGKVIGASGGGGTAQGRPVAVISVQGDVVQVTSIIDFTKIGLTALAVVGSFLAMWHKVR